MCDALVHAMLVVSETDRGYVEAFSDTLIQMNEYRQKKRNKQNGKKRAKYKG